MINVLQVYDFNLSVKRTSRVVDNFIGFSFPQEGQGVSLDKTYQFTSNLRTKFIDVESSLIVHVVYEKRKLYYTMILNLGLLPRF